LKDFISENLASERIQYLKSLIVLPFFFIKKEDGSLRLIQDYRKLNKGTIKNKYPLPLIQELLDKVKDSKYFTKLNKAAFRTNLGLFELTVMFFSLTNAPATFQGFVNNIFSELINEGSVVVYLDNILIYSKDIEEYKCLIQNAQKELLDKGEKYPAIKCSFIQESVDYLGFIIGRGEVCMDLTKVTIVQNWL
ncbi:DNA/RNA polymerase, partial [Fomitiporia mediterranea MF3/22]|uniref:DNA/RNA polymerase n=1 Tax=Fomitiporia mediterranea (strain MF3/22) TaxID=694068 RepID=UPI0004409379